MKKLFTTITVVYFLAILSSYSFDPPKGSLTGDETYLSVNTHVPNFNLNSTKYKAASPKGYGAGWGQGSMAFSIGYGWPNWSKALFSTYSIFVGYESSGLGPIHVKGEYGISHNMGIGLSINHVSFTGEWPDFFGTTSIKTTSTSFLLRLNIYFGGNDIIVPYWGVGLGAKIASFDMESDDFGFLFTWKPIPVGFETTFGMRILVLDNFGFYVEVGIAKALFQAGLTAQL